MVLGLPAKAILPIILMHTFDPGLKPLESIKNAALSIICTWSTSFERENRFQYVFTFYRAECQLVEENFRNGFLSKFSAVATPSEPCGFRSSHKRSTSVVISQVYQFCGMLKMRLQCDNKTLHRYHRKNSLRCFLAIYDGTQINQAKSFIVL